MTYLPAWLSVIIWAGLIFLLSSTPNLRTDLADPIDFGLRKTAHVVVYGILGVLLARAGRRTFKKIKTALLVGLILGVTVAVLDEFNQTFTPGRNGRIEDVIIDLVGLLPALLWLRPSGPWSGSRLLHRLRPRRRPGSQRPAPPRFYDQS